MADSPFKTRPPPPFKITAQTHISEEWKKWQKSYRCYANAVNVNQKSHDVQLSTFKSLIGPEGLEIYNTFSILDTVDVETVIQKFDEHFKPKVNVTLERYKLYRLRQKSGQNFDEFLTDITNQADKCDFRTMRDEIVLYKIVGGVEDEDVRKVLLADENLKYDKAVEICRAYKAKHFMMGDGNYCEIASKVGPRVVLKPLSELLQKPCKNQQKLSRKIAKTSKRTRSSAKKVQNEEASKFVVEIKTKSSAANSKGEEKELASQNDGSSSGNGRDSDWRCDDDDDVGGMSTVAADPNIPGQSFTCDICGKGFAQKRALTKHIAIHQTKDYSTCHYCGKKFRMKYYLARHMVQAHSDIMGTTPRVYSCDVCDYKTIVGPNMRRHKFQHTEDKPFSCELCDYKCIVGHLMKAHMAKHTGEKPFVCDVCHKTFAEGGALKKHMFKHMSQDERLRQVKRPVDSGAKELGMNSCETCGKVFSSKAALRNHLLIHTGEKPYACKVCDYKTAHRSAVMIHMNLKHSSDKPFVCNVCGYACKLKAALQSHMNIHSGDRPYACKLCDSKFKQAAHLSVHMRTHTGERPYVCDVCGHRWANQSNLRQHMKIHQQSGESQQGRKRRKKPKNPAPNEPPIAIPQWSEQVSTINPMDCYPVETPSFPYGNPRPSGADCRLFETRQWPSQTNSQNPNNTRIATMRHDAINP